MSIHPITRSNGGTNLRRIGNELEYVLVADTDDRRIDACLEAIKPHGRGVLVARTSEQAVEVLRRFGPATLIIADVLLPPQDGLVVVEAARQLDHVRTGVIVWSGERALREFAICRLAGLNARVLRGSAPPDVIRRVVDDMLRTRTPPDGRSEDPQSSETTEEALQLLQTRARELCGTAGIAVYLREGPGQPFRSSGSWTPDEPLPDTLDALPHALNRVLETQEAFVAVDVTAEGPRVAEQRLAGGPRGLVAVPVFGRDLHDVIGMICAFGVKPLTLAPKQIEALQALGRAGVGTSAETAGPRAAFGARRRVGPVGVPSGPIRDTGQPTALMDRTVGSAAIAREMARVRRDQNPLSVVLFDMNAASEADAAAEATAKGSAPILEETLTRVIRGSDLAIRWSRRELLLVLPGVGKTEADRVAARVRQAVLAGADGRLSIAGGVAELGSDTFESLLARASRELHEAGATLKES